MGITNLEEDIRNKETKELIKEFRILREQCKFNIEYKLIKKELKERGEEV